MPHNNVYTPPDKHEHARASKHTVDPVKEDLFENHGASNQKANFTD